MNRIFQVCVIALVSVVWAGCASTTMRTARQLEPGDVVLSGSAEEFGAFLIPRVSVQGIYGFGLGDVSAHVGTSVFLYNAGVGSRFYLGERWNLGLQLDGFTLPGARPTWQLATGAIFSGSLTLTSSVRSDSGMYGGLYLGALGAHEQDTSTFEGMNAGIIFGADVLQGDNWGMQVESRFSPLMLSSTGRVGVFPVSTIRSVDFDSNLTFILQFGVGIYRRLRTKEQIPASESVWMVSSVESFE